MKSIIFYYHDPNTFNHLKPVYEKLQHNNKKISNIKNEDKYDANIGVYGLSTNQIELNVKKQHDYSILYIEGLVGNRLNDIQTLDFDIILVCNEKCKSQLENNYNNKVISIGDTFYNELICRNVKNTNKDIVTIFLSPDDKTMDDELMNINNYYLLIDNIKNHVKDRILIRFHPRTSKQVIQTIENRYKNNEQIFFNNIMKNEDIINKSTLTFSVGSTMYYESILNDVPSCFVNIDEKFKNLYSLFVMDEIVYTKNEKQLQNFIAKPYIKHQFLETHTNAINNFIHILDEKKRE
jgi:hypothetical protein